MVSAIIVAAGKGIRMASGVPKQYLMLKGRPIVSHTLLLFDQCSKINEIYLVVPAQDFDFCRKNVISDLGLTKPIKLVPGGVRRQDSVYNGLKALNRQTELVVIHDGVRPFVHPEKLVECIYTAEEFGACILGIPASDTLKRVGSGIIKNSLDRNDIWLAQTPQVFKHELILKGHEAAQKDGFSGTDDALLVERLGIDVRIIAGSKDNIKITTREDLTVAQAILSEI